MSQLRQELASWQQRCLEAEARLSGAVAAAVSVAPADHAADAADVDAVPARPSLPSPTDATATPTAQSWSEEAKKEEAGYGPREVDSACVQGWRLFLDGLYSGVSSFLC